jgi:HSP20 family protein
MNDFPSLYRDNLRSNGNNPLTPVNISESEHGYKLEVVAPGWNKEDFKIDLDQNTLTISAELNEQKEAKEEKQIRREYSFRSFKRSFTLDESIDAEQIAAQYVNGILTLNLPKKAEVKPAIKQINIQ